MGTKYQRLLPKIDFSHILLTLSFVFVFSCSGDDGVSQPPEQGQPEEEIQIDPADLLPRILINTNGNAIVDEPKIVAQMNVSKNDIVSFDGPIGIEIRGASSQTFPKKSYGLETWDAADSGIDVSILGLPEEEDWILYGPYSDKSLLRNVLVYELSRDMGRYASRTQFVELTLNGLDQGVYVFMEKLKRDAERIPINKLNEDENTGEDLTGGYILKIDKTAGSNLGEGYNELNSFESQFAPLNATSGQKIYFLYEEPKAEDITPEQKTYISTYIGDFENALASDDFTDPDTGYAKYIDVDSFIDFFILNEISNNVDGYRLSTFMHKDKNGKLNMGPIWDFNLAFGNADYCSGGETNVWAHRFNERCPDDFWQIPFWWQRLLQDPVFVQGLKERWLSLRTNVLSNTTVQTKINGYTILLEKAGAIDQNFKIWNILGTYIWPNNFVGSTYESEKAYLNNWFTDRMAWLDTAIDQL